MGTLQAQCKTFSERLSKLAANLQDIANDPNAEGCAALENALGVEELAREFTEWYITDRATAKTVEQGGHVSTLDVPEAEERCAYCGADVPTDEGVPSVDDDDAWRDLAETHSTGCEWVETRAHRLPRYQDA